jgi:hypothetical protein
VAIFAIIPTPNPNNTKLAMAIAEHFKEENYPIDGDRGWLISANLPGKAVSDLLGITDGRTESALVLEVASYFGRANPNIWSWIKLHWEAGRNA